MEKGLNASVSISTVSSSCFLDDVHSYYAWFPHKCVDSIFHTFCQELTSSLQPEWRWGSGSPKWHGKRITWGTGILFCVTHSPSTVWPKAYSVASGARIQVLPGSVICCCHMLAEDSLACALLSYYPPCSVPRFLFHCHLCWSLWINHLFLPCICCGCLELEGDMGIKVWVSCASLIWNLSNLFVFSVFSFFSNKKGMKQRASWLAHQIVSRDFRAKAWLLEANKLNSATHPQYAN